MIRRVLDVSLRVGELKGKKAARAMRGPRLFLGWG
jgi:hypothetical protein